MVVCGHREPTGDPFPGRPFPRNYGFTVWVIVGDVLGLKVLLPP